MTFFEGLTKHGRRRVHQRLKIPVRAAARHAQRARDEGARLEELTGVLRIMVEKVRDSYRARDMPADYFVWRGVLYIFSHDGALITCYALDGDA